MTGIFRRLSPSLKIREIDDPAKERLSKPVAGLLLAPTNSRTPMSQVHTESGQPAPPKPATIYAVDDEEMITTVVEAILEAEGYEVRAFQDPTRALGAFTEAAPKPDLLITDFVMGEMNGMELIEQCKKLVPELKTILLSGTVTEEFIRQFPTQPHKFLAKPFQAEQLVNTVATVLNARAA